MKFHQEAARKALGSATPRTLALILLSVFGALLPSLSFAAEKDVVLKLTNSDNIYLYISFAVGLLALGAAWALAKGVLAASPGNEKMQEVGLAIKDGALAYLKTQVRTMAIFVVILAIGLGVLFKGAGVPIAFIAGVLASYIAGYTGMVMAVNGNMRTANAALTSYKKSLEVAFRSGGVAGMVTVGMGLIGATIIIFVGRESAMQLLVGFGFGGSLAALFMRVGGGIFTKAADVGADLVGKVEAGIPEDDARNPATIADNVGDNVGDCAGMAADIFESYEVTLVAAIVLGAATASIFDQETWMKLILFALMARGVGILASILGIFSVRGSDDIDSDPLKAVRKGFYVSAAVALVATFALAYGMMGQSAGLRTTQLVTSRTINQAEADSLIAARNAVAKEKSIPAWKVDPKDILARPEAKDFGADIQASPGMSVEDQKAQQISQIISMNDQAAETGQAAPPTLSGYAPITLDSGNPALGYTIPWIYTSKEEQQKDQASRTPGDTGKNISIKDALSQNLLDLVMVKVQQSPPAGSQQPAQPPVYVGPLSRKLAEEYKKTPPNPTIKLTDFVDVKIYADNAGNLALGVPLEKKDFLKAQGGMQYWKVSPDELAAVNKANAAATAPNAFKPQPPVSAMQLATIEHQQVPWWTFALAIAFGILMAFAIEMLTDYYVSTHKKPTQEVAGVSNAGPAPMIIQGFAYAAESSVFMVFALVVALMFPLFIFNPAVYGTYILSFYGIALVGLGLLTTTGYVLAMDTFGPISDNAQGVFEMSGAGHESEMGAKAVQRLDAAGNTTKALTKGFAIATAVVAAVALFHSYLQDAHLATIGLRLDVPEIFLGLMIGAAAPYLFSAFAINAVGRAAFELITEVRRQFRSDPGIMAGTSKPNYAVCVSIVTAAAQRELLGPGILAIALPVAVGFGFSIGKPQVLIGNEMFNLTGAQALGGFLAGAIVSGQLLAVLLANSGGMWDNAKKIIEDGLYGGKGSEAHKAGVVCDTVGDPFKDTAGPALNPLIKVMNLVALLLAPIVVTPYSTGVLITVTAVAVLALIIAIIVSKKGSLSTEMQKVAKEADHQASLGLTDGGHPTVLDAPEVAAPTKRRITVEDDDTTV